MRRIVVLLFVLLLLVAKARPAPKFPLGKETTYVTDLRNINGWFDRIAAALRVKDRAELEKELDLVHEDLKVLKDEVTEPGGLAGLPKEGNAVKAFGK
jgi:hypothetical protein